MIEIFFSGDFAPRLRICKLIENGDYQHIFNDILPVIKDADYAVTNLESPLIDSGTPLPKTGPNLKAPPKSIEALKYAEFDLVTLANNHIMDYGAEGLRSTMQLCQQNSIEYVGAGENYEKAKTIKYVTINDGCVAFINICENEWSTTYGNEPGANPLDEVSLYYQVQDAKQHSDYQIVIIHGGHELYEYLSIRMKKLYRWIIDLGVTAVVGHHTHCFCGYEIYNGNPIFYSLGNFVFDREFRNNMWNYGAAIVLKLDKDSVEYDIYPYEQCNDEPGIRLMKGHQLEEWNNKERKKTKEILDDAALEQHFEDFVRLRSRQYRSYLEPHSNKLIMAAKNRGWIPRRIKGTKRLQFQDIIRCEAHRDVLLSILKDDK